MSSDAMDVDSMSTPEMQGSVMYAEQEAVEKLLDVLKGLAKTTATFDSRFVWRALKELSFLRGKLLSQENLAALVNILYPDSSTFKTGLLKLVNDNKKSSVPRAEEIRNRLPASFYTVANSKSIEVVPEVNAFIHLAVQLYLLDRGKLDDLQKFNKEVVLPRILLPYNQRSLDLIMAKLWFNIVICQESMGNKCDPNTRSEMIKFLKTASLRHDDETKAMLITLILRNFLYSGDVESADDFVTKVDFPTMDVSSPLEARFYFYLSKINAIQLDYSTANEYIIASIRKAPNTNNSLGFLQQANKLHCVIQLLMGDIPALSFFHQQNMEKSLEPYYYLSKAVRLGDLKKFASAITTYKTQLIKDGNLQLCVRLRSNVIKTGIRIISLTYKKITLKDICMKLRLDSEQTAEYMVSRAIRDGVIEAKINHEQGYIETNELLNVYDTTDPQQMFDERIKFVNQLHDECATAMRYPSDKKMKSQNGSRQEDFIDGDFFDDISDYSDLDDLGFL